MTHNWGSRPRRVVPANWNAIKAAILKRDDGRCHVCGGPGATEVDHIVNVARGGTHAPSNLAAIHKTPCHANKTKAEAAEGAARWRAARSRKRPPEPHPGLIR